MDEDKDPKPELILPEDEPTESFPAVSRKDFRRQAPEEDVPGFHPDEMKRFKTQHVEEVTPVKDSKTEEEAFEEPEVLTEEEPDLQEKMGKEFPCQLVINLGAETLETLVFDQEVITIGRDNNCDVVIDNLGASRVHAQIERIGRFYLLTDLESKTGTFVRGKKIDEYSLNSGEEIFLAKHTIVFQKLTTSARWHTSNQDSKSEKPKTGRQQMMQTMRVDFRNMAKKQGPAPAQLSVMGTRHRLPITKNIIFFGKNPNCDLNVTGFLIGDRHVVLVREEKGFFLYHLGLFKPPRVNNKQVEFTAIKDGDLIQIGSDFRFVFHGSEGQE